MIKKEVLRAFSNVGFASSGRSFPGFPGNSGFLRRRLAPRETLRLELLPGDVVAVEGLATGEKVSLLVYDDRGHPDPKRLGLDSRGSLAAADFDSDALNGWLSANGLTAAREFAVVEATGDGRILVLKARDRCHLWVIRALAADELVACAGVGSVTVVHKPVANDAAVLPPPLAGELRDEFTVDRATARAYELRRGEIVQIIDVEGQQCSDFVAFRRQPLDGGEEVIIDSTATRSMVRRSYPGPGLFDKFYDRDMRPMLNVVQDTCGRHDAFGLACTARGYEERGFPGHVNCSDNISDAAAAYDVTRRAAWPAINFFWNTWVDPHSQQILTEESHSRPGDYVAMRAMDDLLCVTTACPDDLDPINGWNPTDVHVRIYRSDAPIRRAVAYREKEDAPMSVSQESPFHECTAPLTSHFAPARDLWAPVSFPSLGTLGEYWACREHVTLQDMSGLRKYDIVGPDAERLLQRATTRDIARLAVWRGSYVLMCDDTGAVIDDGTLFRLGPELFRWCCGTEESARVLDEIAREQSLQVRIHALGNALPNLALQGPKSRDLLRKIVFTQPQVPALDQLKWFGVTVARLNDREGLPFMLSRTGYTGELGYELFCASADAVALWNAVMQAGEAFGIEPMGSAALEIMRIEAGLAAANAEFAPGVDAFEAGLGFAVDLNKADFTGKTALARNAGEPRRLLRGMLLDCDDVPLHGAPVLAGEREVGNVTSATRSPMLQRAVAMARLAVEHAEIGAELEIGQMDGRMKRLAATVAEVPFVDPQRTRARA